MYNGTAPPSSPGDGTSFHCRPTDPSDLILDSLETPILLVADVEGTAIDESERNENVDIILLPLSRDTYWQYSVGT